jgi:hypothetical protein
VNSRNALFIKYELYDADMKNVMLPFEKGDITVRVLNDSVIEAHSVRVMHHDTTNNSSSSNRYTSEHNTLIPLNDKE